MRPIEPSKDNVLVTGATGFVGGNLVEALLLRGYAVTCLVRATSDIGMLQRPSVRLVFGDLDDRAAVRNAAKAMRTIYHVAGATKASGREQFFKINQAGTRRLLEAAAEVNPKLSRFVHMSSLAAAGPSPEGQGLIEDARPNPVSWYGESKLRSEEEALRYAGAFPVTILRPSAVYGPGDKDILLFFRMIQKGFLLTPGTCDRSFSLIHVNDLVNATLKAGEANDMSSGEVFFISRPEAYVWEDVGRAIAHALGKNYRRISLPQWMVTSAGFTGDLYARITGRPAAINSQKVKELLQQSWLCDSSKARVRLGFSPSIDLEGGIRETARWYQNRGWL